MDSQIVYVTTLTGWKCRLFSMRKNPNILNISVLHFFHINRVFLLLTLTWHTSLNVLGRQITVVSKRWLGCPQDTGRYIATCSNFNFTSPEPSPSWETVAQIAKKFTALFLDSAFHVHLHRSLPLVSVLNQTNPVHSHSFTSLKDDIGIYLSPPRSSKWRLSLKFSHQSLHAFTFLQFIPHSPPISSSFIS